MFDIGMGEIGLIAVIALIVLGPERLPGAARTAGALLHKARQSWQSVRAEIERELAAEELKRKLKETVTPADLGSAVHEPSHQTSDNDAPMPAPPSIAAATPPHTTDERHRDH